MNRPILGNRQSSPAAWNYDDSTGGRDERIDLLRGLAMLAVIVNHVAIPSFYQFLSAEGVGVVTGAEGFVLLSGVVAGVVYRSRLERNGWRAAAAKLSRRAVQLYVVAIATNLMVYLLRYVPLLDASILMAYRDSKTGEAYPLYGDRPSVAVFAANMITLEYGPSQVNILGLYVALVAATPFLLWLLQNGRALLVVGMSWCIYIIHAAHPVHVLPFQSENSFPILAWQLLFVHGVAGGYHRDRLVTAFRGKRGSRLRVTVVSLAVALCFFALSNPWHEVRGSAARISLIPEPMYYWIYEHFFQRTTLGIGRFINTLVLAATLYMVLTRFWVPSKKLVGWFCVPIGQATLYVFVVHLVYVLAVHNAPLLQRDLMGVNTVAHTIVLFTIWAMVRKRVAFRLIPR